MIKIKFTNGKPALEFPEAETIKEAVELAAAKKISLNGAYLYRVDLSGASLYRVDLGGADLIGANLRRADLSRANLRRADLSRANLDYSNWPLWCGSLTAKIDKRLFVQLLYHVVRAGQSVEDEEVRKFLDLPEVIRLANQFHRTKECGEIKGAGK